MATAKEIVSGVGVRYAVVIPLDADGLPSINTSTATPQQGSLVSGIKTWGVNDPAPQRITHYGDDRPFAQDSLPPTEVGSFTITTAKTNLEIDAMVAGVKIRTVGNNTMIPVNTDKKGDEPFVAVMGYRQALDTDPDSGTFGKLRQWNWRLFGSARVTPQTQSYEQTNTDKTYEGTPTPVKTTLWNEVLNETNWGATQTEHLEGVSNYQPIVNWWLGNGTLTSFQLTHPPFSSDELTVWVDGTLTSPSSVNTSTSNPAFTLGAAAANAKKVVALIGTNAAVTT